jgi:hypothetical protein
MNKYIHKPIVEKTFLFKGGVCVETFVMFDWDTPKDDKRW